MFFLKSTHNQFVKLLTEQYEARIAVLQDQISDLRRMVFTPTSSTDIPLVAREADAIITGNSDVPLLPDEAAINEMREFDAVISGEYDQGIM